VMTCTTCVEFFQSDKISNPFIKRLLKRKSIGCFPRGRPRIESQQQHFEESVIERTWPIKHLLSNHESFVPTFFVTMSRAHQTRRSGRLLRLGFNAIAQFLSKSEVLVALSIFSSPYFFHQ
jgi:hypothetical protein